MTYVSIYEWNIVITLSQGILLEKWYLSRLLWLKENFLKLKFVFNEVNFSKLHSNSSSE